MRRREPSGKRSSTSHRLVARSQTGPAEKSRLFRSSMRPLRSDRTARYEVVQRTALQPDEPVAVLDELDLAVGNPVSHRPRADAQQLRGLDNREQVCGRHLPRSPATDVPRFASACASVTNKQRSIWMNASFRTICSTLEERLWTIPLPSTLMSSNSRSPLCRSTTWRRHDETSRAMR